MKFRTIALATAALSLAATPAIATVAFERSSAPSEDASEIEGSGTGLIAGLFAAAAVIGGIIVISDNEQDDAPVSP